MATGIATQLITVGATLSGVVLTLVTNAYLEGRRARVAALCIGTLQVVA